jgi:hypothetical protein
MARDTGDVRPRPITIVHGPRSAIPPPARVAVARNARGVSAHAAMLSGTVQFRQCVTGVHADNTGRMAAAAANSTGVCLTCRPPPCNTLDALLRIPQGTAMNPCARAV